MTPTKKQVENWANKHIIKRVKEKDSVIECVEGEDQVEFHLQRQSQTTFKLQSVEPLSDFMRGAPVNLN